MEQRIVIVGGGFAGVTLAQYLESRTSPDIEIVVISTDNHLVFTPMLPEVAGRTISAFHAVVPGRQWTKRTKWISASATAIDRSTNTISYSLTHSGTDSLTYTNLVLACGSSVDLHAVPGMSAHAYPLKSVGDAIVLGNDVIGCFERAVVEKNAEERRRFLTTVVIGGGFSGVEIAGHLFDLAVSIRRFYPQLSNEAPRLVLLQRGKKVLPELEHESLSAFTLRKMRQNGIEVRLEAEVGEITANDVRLKSGERINTGLVVCTVGTTTHELIRKLNLTLEKGRLRTDSDMRVSGTTNLWAIGDCAFIPNAFNGKPCSPTAQFALHQAKQLAGNIVRDLKQQQTYPFRFRPQGLLASIGHRNGVAEIYGVQFSGVLAWVLWKGVYLWKVPTVARKLELAVDWAWQMLFPANIVRLHLPRMERVRQAHYGAGDYICHRGNPGDQFFVISQGTALAYLDEHRPPVAKLQPGDHFGVGALLSPDAKGRHTASVKAESSLDLLVMEREDFLKLSGSLGILKKITERSLLVQQIYRHYLDQIADDPAMQKSNVQEAMISPARTLPMDLPLTEVVDLFQEGKTGYPVVDFDGVIQGYCGRTELYSALGRALPPETPVSEFLRKEVTVLTEGQGILEAVVEYFRRDMEVLPVIKGNDTRIVTGTFSPIEVFQRQAKSVAQHPR